MSVVEQASSKNREKILMIIAGVLFLGLAIPTLYYLYGSAVGTQLKRRRDLQKQVDDLDLKTRNESVTRRLDSYMKRSLPPTDDFLAPSLYQNWLIEQAGRCGISDPKIDAGSSRTVKEVYKCYTFTFRGKASLAKLVEFLREFQHYDHLHLIRSMSIKPLKESRELDITISIETLALLQAPRGKTLTMNVREPAPDSVAEENRLKRITERAFFSAYVPPSPPGTAPPPSEEKPKFNPAPYCFVTAVVETKGRSEVWIDHRTEGKKERLHVGDRFTVGTVSCVISRIEFGAVEIETGNAIFRVKVGDAFADAEFVRDLPKEPEKG